MSKSRGVTNTLTIRLGWPYYFGTVLFLSVKFADAMCAQKCASPRRGVQTWLGCSGPRIFTKMCQKCRPRPTPRPQSCWYQEANGEATGEGATWPKKFCGRLQIHKQTGVFQGHYSALQRQLDLNFVWLQQIFIFHGCPSFGHMLCLWYVWVAEEGEKSEKSSLMDTSSVDTRKMFNVRPHQECCCSYSRLKSTECPITSLQDAHSHAQRTLVFKAEPKQRDWSLS